jgi:hypothetical protein
MDNILYLAIVFFCMNDQCGVISIEKPFENYDSCMVEVEAAESKLKSDKNITIVSGRCARFKYGVKI